MTIGEFRAWLSGYEVSFADGVPSAEQWAEVKRHLAKVFLSAPVSVPSTWTMPYQLCAGQTFATGG